MITMKLLIDRVEWWDDDRIIQIWNPSCPCEMTMDTINRMNNEIISEHRQSSLKSFDVDQTMTRTIGNENDGRTIEPVINDNNSYL